MLQLVRRPERVAGAAHEEARHGDAREVLDAQRLRLARRVQRIAEQHEPERGERIGVVGNDERTDAAAHRPAAEHQAVGRQLRAARQLGRGFAHRCLEHGRPIRAAPPRGLVREVEAQRRDLRVGERVGDRRQRGRVHVGAGAVREQHRAIGAALRPLVLVSVAHPRPCVREERVDACELVGDGRGAAPAVAFALVDVTFTVRQARAASAADCSGRTDRSALPCSSSTGARICAATVTGDRSR